MEKVRKSFNLSFKCRLNFRMTLLNMSHSVWTRKFALHYDSFPIFDHFSFKNFECETTQLWKIRQRLGQFIYYVSIFLGFLDSLLTYLCKHIISTKSKQKIAIHLLRKHIFRLFGLPCSLCKHIFSTISKCHFLT